MNDRDRTPPPTIHRRRLLVGGALVAATDGFSSTATSAPSTKRPPEGRRSSTAHHERRPMGNFTTKDGTRIYYKDWGTGRPVMFSHGWPLSADAWDVPTLIAHGDDDQIVPIGNSALLSAKLVKGSTLKIYKRGSHALGDTSREEFNADLRAFARS
jgi:non-heme chloroperoxidase